MRFYAAEYAAAYAEPHMQNRIEPHMRNRILDRICFFLCGFQPHTHMRPHMRRIEPHFATLILTNTGRTKTHTKVLPKTPN